MRVLDLFSGIGGFSLGLERAGMRTVAFCEIDPFCRRVLRKHWPNVPIYEDVRTLTADQLRADGIVPDVICGGFPCQDISAAGNKVGIEGARSGLWSEYARLIGEIRPRFAIVENVAALLNRGIDRVLGDLAAIGFDAEWHCIPACAVGAPHRRDRVWIIATDTGRERWGLQSIRELGRRNPPDAANDGEARAVADTQGQRRGEAGQHRKRSTERPAGCGEVLADSPPNGCRQGRKGRSDPSRTRKSEQTFQGVAHADFEQVLRSAIARPECNPWDTEPALGRVVDGVPHKMVEDELRALGNAVVPQIPEIIGRAIMASVPLPETI